MGEGTARQRRTARGVQQPPHRRVAERREPRHTPGVGPAAAVPEGPEGGIDGDRADVGGDGEPSGRRSAGDARQRGPYVPLQFVRVEGVAAESRRAGDTQLGEDFAPYADRDGPHGRGADIDRDDMRAHSASILSRKGNPGSVQLVVNSTTSPRDP